MAPRIVVAGVTSLYTSVAVDEFPLQYAPTSNPVWMRTGVTGAGGHIAHILRHLGDEVRLCTLAGSDPAGLAIRNELRARELLGPGVLDLGVSSLGVVLMAPGGKRMGFPYLAAVNTVSYPPEVFRQQAAGADLAVMTNARFVGPLVDHAARLNIPVAVDVHLISDIGDAYNQPWLEVADIVFCSHERLPCPPPEWIARVFARYPGCTVVGIGRGPDGCSLGLRDGTLVQVPAVLPRGVVNTAGAGDALFASFLHGWIATGNPVAAIETAVLHAGWKLGDAVPVAASLTEAELAVLQEDHPIRAVVGRWDADRPVMPRQAVRDGRRPPPPEGIPA